MRHVAQKVFLLTAILCGGTEALAGSGTEAQPLPPLTTLLPPLDPFQPGFQDDIPDNHPVSCFIGMETPFDDGPSIYVIPCNEIYAVISGNFPYQTINWCAQVPGVGEVCNPSGTWQSPYVQ